MAFNYNYHLNANALYVSLRREHKENQEVDYTSIFLHTSVKGNEFDGCTNELDKRIAKEMTEQEQYMTETLQTWWNENETVDYESAIEALCECFEKLSNGYGKDHGLEVSEEHINWCSNCGMPFLDGYQVGKGDTACSGSCMNKIISRQFDIPVELADDKFVELSEEENNGSFFTSEYI